MVPPNFGVWRRRIGDGMMGLHLPVAHDGIRPQLGRLLVSAAVAALAFAVASPAALAQVGSISQPVVQPLPARSSGVTLNQALARLGQNPRDIDALVDAGNAALTMGDVDAAVGFFRRADQISPGNARVKAGLAGALVHGENPYDAIPMFEEAERAGAGDGALAGERGLAYDLVGDNEKAQRYYQLALAKGADDEITRRLALSYAIAGDRKSSETVLTPQLQRQDKAAWRTRAFALAALGQVDEAVSIANTTLPASLASGISPYLRYMPRLTAAQQAAAANLGHFPRASEIGRDDPRVAQYAPKTRKPPQQAAAEPAATPRGQGRGDRTRRGRSDTALAANTNATSWRDATSSMRGRNAPPAASSAIRPATPAPAARPASLPAASAQPAPTPSVAQVTPPPRASGELPPVSAPRAVAAATPPPATPPPASTPPARTPPAAPTNPPVSTTPAPGPSLSISSSTVQGPPAPTPADMGPPVPPAPTAVVAATAPQPQPPAPSAPTPTPTPAPKVSLTDAFSDFLRPTIDVAPASGAVDVRRLAPSRQADETRPTQGRKATATPAAAAKPVKPPPPSHPSRIWVQVATGRNKSALAFDWRRMLRESAQALRGKQGFISAWGQTNRLLTGPFPTEAAANTFIAQARRGGVDGAFVWTSPAGQVVDPLAAK